MFFFCPPSFFFFFSSFSFARDYADRLATHSITIKLLCRSLYTVGLDQQRLS